MAATRTPRQTLDALATLFAPQLQAAFLAGIADVVDNVTINNVIAAVQSGNVDAAFRTLGFSNAAMRPLTVMIDKAYETGGVLTGQTFPKYLNTPSGKAIFRFDVRNSRAEAWLRDNSSTLITRVQDDTKTNIRNILTGGMEKGQNPRAVALDIVGRIDPTTGKRSGGIVGLTPGQEGWVQSAKTKLQTLDPAYFDMGLRDKRFDGTVAKAISAGTPLSADVIDKLTGSYRNAALKYRGEMIGRTEAMQSLNASEYEATKQAVDMGAVSKDAVQREWDSAGDDRVRPSHRLLNGQRVGLDDPFIAPDTQAEMLHPGDTSLGAPASEIIGCRCRVRSVIDWLADVD